MLVINTFPQNMREKHDKKLDEEKKFPDNENDMVVKS
jgi:hypothetical protein